MLFQTMNHDLTGRICQKNAPGTLVRAKQSQSTPEETEYVADTNIKCTFLIEYSFGLPRELKHAMWVSLILYLIILGLL